MAVDEKQMKNSRRQKRSIRKKKTGRGEELLCMIQANRVLMEHIEQVYQFDQVRVGVLRHIFLKMGQLEKEEMKREIYRYGSLIKGDDLLARQMFLWLLGIAERIGV